MILTPLENDLRERLGGETLASWQLKRLNRTLALAKNHSPFYREHLPAGEVRELDELADMPLMTDEPLRRQPERLLCVSGSEIARVVTLQTSGTRSAPKRLFFTKEDQRLTRDFFACGVRVALRPGETVLVLLPCDREGGVGRLICESMDALPARAIPHGMVKSLPETLDVCLREAADVIIGMPVPVLILARYSVFCGKIPPVKRVLLTADHVPDAVKDALRELWGCDVYEHYGMTEMGLGGGVDCEAHAGYHLREADLLFEVIDPDTGKNVPEGEWGEVVFTTLTRRGMPLIRYRTGDRSRFLPGPCPCGGTIRRLDYIDRRIGNEIVLPGGVLDMPLLEEALFPLRSLADFRASCREGPGGGRELAVEGLTMDGWPPLSVSDLEKALEAVPVIASALAAGALSLAVSLSSAPDLRPLYGAKRAILSPADIP